MTPEMKLVTFFVYLFFFLLRGYDCVYIGTDQKCVHYTPQQNIEKTSLHRISGREDQQTPQDCFLAEEIEDDETENFFTRKYILLSQALFSLPVAAHTDIKAPPVLFNLPSCKYITQRALRI